MTFGLTVSLDWWQWLLMVLGAGFCWTAGCILASRVLGAVFARRPSP